MSRKFKSQAEMFPLIERWQSSSLSQSAFCLEHDVSLSTFGYWRSKYMKSMDTDGDFISIEAEHTPSRLEVLFPNGVRVFLDQLDTSVLESLIRCY